MLITILLVFVMLSVLVLLHEWGHFVSARRNGIVAEEFGFGFPPRLFGKTVRGTLYSVNALPFGGFVRMKGEDSSSTAKGSFGAATFKAKTKVLLAGVGMNLATAYVIL